MYIRQLGAGERASHRSMYSCNHTIASERASERPLPLTTPTVYTWRIHREGAYSCIDAPPCNHTQQLSEGFLSLLHVTYLSRRIHTAYLTEHREGVSTPPCRACSPPCVHTPCLTYREGISTFLPVKHISPVEGRTKPCLTHREGVSPVYDLTHSQGGLCCAVPCCAVTKANLTSAFITPWMLRPGR